MSKTLLTFFILWFFLSRGFSQKVKLNDSTYLELSEATRTKNEKLTQRKWYNVKVLFTGFFRKNLIQVTHNGLQVFSGTVTTVDKDFEYIFPLRDFTFEAKKINSLYVAVNVLK